ncbi:MAG: hypothetical protein ACTS5I_00225 [Rhodanobacter sp.]
MNTLTIPTAILAAVAPFMAKKDVRYYLNGAMVETAAGGLRAVATDGFRTFDSLAALKGAIRA